MPGETPEGDDAGRSEVFAYFSLEGERFNAPGMPASATTEVSAFAEMVYVLARAAYLEASGQSQVPHGFKDAFDLRLTSVREGSAQPQLMLNRPARVTDEQWDEWVGFYETARDRAADGVSAVSADSIELDSRLAPARTAVRRFGKTLRPNERMVFGAPDDASRRAELSDSTHDIIRRISAVVEEGDPAPEPLTVTGMVTEYDSTSRRFQLRPVEGPPVTCVFTHQLLLAEQARAALSRDGINGPDVQVVGLARPTSAKNSAPWITELLDVTVVRSAEEKDPMPKFEVIAGLQDGWFGAGSIGPNQEVLALARELLATEEFRRRSTEFAPTPSGGVTFEFRRGQLELTAAIEPGPVMSFVIDNLETDHIEEREAVEFDFAEFVRFVARGDL